MSDSELQTLKIDLAALESVVWALVRAQGRRSRGHLHELMDSLRAEAERLALLDDVDTHTAGLVLEGWIEELKSEAALA